MRNMLDVRQQRAKVATMNLRQLFDAIDAEAKRELAAKVDSNLVYLFQIAGGDRNPSPALARRLVQAEPRLKLHDLRPDIWSKEAA